MTGHQQAQIGTLGGTDGTGQTPIYTSGHVPLGTHVPSCPAVHILSGGNRPASQQKRKSP